MRQAYYHPARRRTRRLFIPRTTAFYGALSAIAIVALLFVNGLLGGVLAAGAIEARRAPLPALQMDAPLPLPAAPMPTQESDELRMAAVPPPEEEAAMPAIASPPPEPAMEEQTRPALPEWAQGRILPKPNRHASSNLYRRLSRPFVSESVRLASGSLGTMERTRDGRPQLGFVEGQPRPAVPYGDLIYTAARRWQLNPALVAAVVQIESNYDARALSHKGARGLMQLMPATAKRFGVSSDRLYDPEPNLYAGTRYLDWLRKRYADDLPSVLAAYNAGEGAVDRHGGIPPYPETRRYVQKAYKALGLTTPTTQTARSKSRGRNAG